MVPRVDDAPLTPDRSVLNGTDPPRKQSLFCPECAFRSPIGGNWLVREDGRGTEHYLCPACRNRVTVRPDFQG